MPFPYVEVTAAVAATSSAHANTGWHMPFNGNALFHLGTNTLSQGHIRARTHARGYCWIPRLLYISELYINISLAVPQGLNSEKKLSFATLM